MDHLCSSRSVADRRVQDAPFGDERDRYLSHCAAHGAKPAVLRVKRNELLWIAQRLGSDADRGVGITELMAIALERQNLHGAATAARRVIDIGRPWLRFLGWWRDPADPLLYRDQSTAMSPGCATSAASRRRRWSSGAERRQDSCGGVHRRVASLGI